MILKFWLGQSSPWLVSVSKTGFLGLQLQNIQLMKVLPIVLGEIEKFLETSSEIILKIPLRMYQKLAF